MLRYLIPCLLISVGVTLAADDGAPEENAVQNAEPPNEWGTYYTLPSELPEMSDLFLSVFKDYVNGANSKTECRENDADFERWYKSSENADYIILSYYCRTKQAHGYEHMKVSKSNRNVIEFQTSLNGFKIMDAGDYETELPDAEGKAIKIRLLGNVTDQIAQQKQDTRDQDQYCPDPGTDTAYSVQTKKENGLYYYRLAISCNVTHTPGYASHMTHIEVVEDRDFQVLNGGDPVLASMEYPTRNSAFIRQKEAEAELQALKQSSGARILASIVTMMLIPAMQILF